MSVEKTREIMERYLQVGHDDASMLADDVVFTQMASGEVYHGPAAVQGMLHHFYSVAFDARAEMKNLFIADGKAALEALVVGKHIGEFAGVPATGQEVSVPLCVIYDVGEDQLEAARVYFEIPAFLKQLGIQP